MRREESESVIRTSGCFRQVGDGNEVGSVEIVGCDTRQSGLAVVQREGKASGE